MELNINVNNISETAFLTLQCHALDAESTNPILNDRSSIETLNVLKDYFSKSKSALHKKLFDNKVKKNLITHIVLRAKFLIDTIPLIKIQGKPFIEDEIAAVVDPLL